MYVENFKYLLEDKGAMKDGKVTLRLYGCGKTYEVEMTEDRVIVDSKGNVTIIADDN